MLARKERTVNNFRIGISYVLLIGGNRVCITHLVVQGKVVKRILYKIVTAIGRMFRFYRLVY